MEKIFKSELQLTFPFEDIERILKDRFKEEDNELIDGGIDSLIKSIIVNLIREGKTDKQIYIQLRFLGRKLNFGRVESLRFYLKQMQRTM